MLIQFDREDSENLVLTFDNSESDAEQMQDFIAWLEASGLEFNKLKMKIPGVSEKVTNLFVKKPSVQVLPPSQAKVAKPAPTPTPTPQVAPPQAPTPQLVAQVEETESETQETVVKNEESSSDTESDEEPVSRTKKTTKRVASRK